MTDIIKSTLDKNSPLQNRLRAIKLYVEGVKEDFPETKTWMDNILVLTGLKDD